MIVFFPSLITTGVATNLFLNFYLSAFMCTILRISCTWLRQGLILMYSGSYFFLWCWDSGFEGEKSISAEKKWTCSLTYGITNWQSKASGKGKLWGNKKKCIYTRDSQYVCSSHKVSMNQSFYQNQNIPRYESMPSNFNGASLHLKKHSYWIETDN